MAWIRFLLTAALVLAGLAICVIGVYGVFRFRYAANRMHAAALNDTLGVTLCLVGLAVSAPDFFSALKLLLVVVFLWISAPVSSHLLCRLEVETNEERAQYMQVHERPLEEERADSSLNMQQAADVSGMSDAADSPQKENQTDQPDTADQASEAQEEKP